MKGGNAGGRAATESLAVATGVVNIWHIEAHAVADPYHRLEAAYPGLRAQVEAGASHLVVHAVPASERLQILAALAPALGI